MKKPRAAELEVVIEWGSRRTGAAHSSSAFDVSREDVLELARALGRLAARRDIEEATSRNAGECLSSASMQGTMSELEPT